MRFLGWLALLLCTSGFVGAETLEEALAWSREELATTRRELSDLRDSVVEEKLPIARELREVRETLLAEQENKRRLDAEKEGGSFKRDQLKARQATSSELAGYLGNQALRFRQNFESDLVIGERFSYADRLLSNEETRPGSSSSLEQVEAQWQVIAAALERLENLGGGSEFETEAVSEEGVLVSGKAIQFGPLVFFQATDGDAAGNLLYGFGLSPELQTLDADHQAAVEGLFNDGHAVTRFDPTLGQATLIHDGKSVPMTVHLARGGFWMIPIGLFGVLAFITSVVKWKNLRRVKLPSIREFEKLRGESSEELADDYRGETKQLVASLLAVNDAAPEIQSAELDVAYQEFKFKMNRWLPIIALTAGVSPLLGLLGTVTGMIKTFELISLFGAGDAKLLSGGISEALITTEFGLVVAIPALVMHAYLQRRVKKILVGSANLMEQVSGGVR